MGACPIELTLIFLSFSFFYFLFSFLSFFSSFFALFFPFTPKIHSVFSSPLQGTTRTFLQRLPWLVFYRFAPQPPLSGLDVLADHQDCATSTLARQRRVCFVPLYTATFLPATVLMLSFSTLRACTQRFLLKLAFFRQSIIPAGRTSQKRLGQKLQIDIFPSPHHQTIPPLPLTSGPWPHHVLYWLGTGWWCLGLARASLSNLSKSLPTAHASAATQRLSVCVSWPFMWVFLWFFAPFRSWTSYDNGFYISLAHF